MRQIDRNEAWSDIFFIFPTNNKTLLKYKFQNVRIRKCQIIHVTLFLIKLNFLLYLTQNLCLIDFLLLIQKMSTICFSFFMEEKKNYSLCNFFSYHKISIISIFTLMHGWFSRYFLKGKETFFTINVNYVECYSKLIQTFHV